MQELNLKKEQIRKENEEKQFKKYATMYFCLKEKQKNLKKKKFENKNKEQEKQERLEEIEKKRENEKKALIKKMQEMERKKQLFDKIRAEQLERCKLLRIKNKENVKNRLDKIAQQEENYRNELLEYQSKSLSRVASQDKLIRLKKISISDKTIENQISFEKSLKTFRKKITQLNNQSIMKKSFEERFAMYKEKKRKEAEKRKKELEEKLEKMNK